HVRALSAAIMRLRRSPADARQVARHSFTAWLWIIPLMLAIAGCGAGGRSLGEGGSPLPLRPGPTGCTRHLVFARGGLSHLRTVALSFDDSPGPSTEAI